MTDPETTGQISQKPKAPWHLWVFGLLTLLWNAVGVISYMVTELGLLESLGFPPDQIAYFDAMPAWAVALWAMGVWGAFLCSVLMLLRSRYAVPMAMVAIVGLMGTTIYQRLMADIPPELDGRVLSLVIWVITVVMLFYASHMRRAGGLR